MNNKTPYQQASFRGVSFHVESANSEIAGRRAVIHEYAGSDTSYPEDLGLKAKSYSLTAYVLGKDYQEKRDALIKACTTKNSGELIHPYLGTLQVLCTACSVSEGTDKGFMASFSLSFALAPNKSTFSPRPDTSATAKLSIKSFASHAQNSFLNKYTPSIMPSFASIALTNLVATVGQLYSEFENFLDAFDPLNIVANTLNAFDTMPFNDALNIASAVSNITAPIATSVAGLEVMRLSDELTNFTRRNALAIGANHLAEKVFVSSNEALKEFFLVDKLIGNELEIASLGGDDSIFFATQDMRYSLTEHIKKTAVHLPEAIKALAPQTDSSLRIAYNLTGSADNALDFAQRNALKHPSFSQGGEYYEVLKNA